MVETQFFGNDERPWWRAMWRGARGRCPQCAASGLFTQYTRTASQCGHCGLALDGHRADDAPPYLTVLVIGHIAIPLALAVKQIFDPPLALQFAVWAPVILGGGVAMLPVAKGAMIGVQWANRMHGFGGDAD